MKVVTRDRVTQAAGKSRLMTTHLDFKFLPDANLITKVIVPASGEKGWDLQNCTMFHVEHLTFT